MTGAHRDLHVLTHSFPTRRASELWESGTQRLCSSRRLPLPAAAREPRVIGPSGAVVPDLSCLRSTVSHHRGHLVNCRGAGSSTRSRRRSRASMSALRSEEHTSELQSLMRISYAVF